MSSVRRVSLPRKEMKRVLIELMGTPSIVHLSKRSLSPLYLCSCSLVTSQDRRMYFKCERLDVSEEITGSAHLHTQLVLDKFVNEVKKNLNAY